MIRAFILGIVVSLLTASTAFACSCGCNFDFHVSDYVKGTKIFWGVPLESRYETSKIDGRRYGAVSTRVQVLEGYGRILKDTQITLQSSPDDGASCGIQLYTGVPQFIVAGSNNGVGSCNCAPPEAYLLDYLVKGKDRYLPDLNDCWDEDNDDRRFKPTEKCKVWADAPEPYSGLGAEERRIYKIFRSEDFNVQD